MRKRARRLWLGDWQRDQEPPPPQPVADEPGETDTFVITPMDDGDAARAAHRRNVRRRVAGLALIALCFALGFAVSSRWGRNLPSRRQASLQAPGA